MFVTALKRDLVAQFRRPSAVLNPLVFFLVVLSLFPLGLGPSPEQLSAVAPAVIWIAALLATLMSLDLMFRDDFVDGSLDQLIASDQPLIGYVAAKVLVHWLFSGLPLVALLPVVGLVMFVDGTGILTMMLGLMLVSPSLSLLGAIGAALTAGLARGGLLITLLILPLYVPLLVFATAMTAAGIRGEETIGFVYWLAAALTLALGLAPLATIAALRVSVDQ